ncbi:MAG: hypothetical protein HND47_11680 [Chloroflexi bacterium]|nr:hypothetical protein [Chloroflexota bacterium]
MKRSAKWAVGILLTATATFVALQNVSAPPDEATETAPPVTVTEGVTIPPTETETATPSSSIPNCAYTWAYHDAPGLTEMLDAAVKELNADAGAHATQFGEDCIAADGSAAFGVMQTDFYVRLPVEDLTNEEAFGVWISEVMQVVTQIPREQIPGPNYGFVEFLFEKNENERLVLRVPIQQYLTEAQGRTGAELFRMFYQQP